MSHRSPIKKELRDRSYKVEAVRMLPVFGLFDRHVNIVNLSVAIYRALDGREDSLLNAPIRPSSMFPKEAEQIAIEEAGEDEIRKWILAG